MRSEEEAQVVGDGSLLEWEELCGGLGLDQLGPAIVNGVKSQKWVERDAGGRVP